MKCKNCGCDKTYHVKGVGCIKCSKGSVLEFHPCEQFIPSEVLMTTNENQISNQNKGCGRNYGTNVSCGEGTYLCPSCSSNSPDVRDKDPDSLKRLDEKGTNTSSGSHTSLSDKIDGLINEFIEEWCGMSAHLLDSDENDGERLRDNLKNLHKEFIRLLKDFDWFETIDEDWEDTLERFEQFKNKLSGSFKW